MIRLSRVLFTLCLCVIGFFFAIEDVPAKQRKEPACTKANSEVLSVREVQAAANELVGECVGVAGLRIAEAIFPDREAVYQFFSASDPRKHLVVGIPYMLPKSTYTMERGVFLGRVKSCRDDQRSFRRTQKALLKDTGSGDDDAIIMIHHRGFCSWNDGVAIYLEDTKDVIEAKEERLVGEINRLKFGDLVPVKENDPANSTIQWLADIALRVPCEPDFKPSAPPVKQSAVSSEVHTPYKDLAWSKEVSKRCPRSIDELTIYRVRETSSSFDSGAKLDLVFCLCRTGDCRERWPIALIDIGWQDRRPYICERASLGVREWLHNEDGTKVPTEWKYQFQQGYGAPGGYWEEEGFAEPPGVN